MVSPESPTAVAEPPALLSPDLDDLGVTFGPDGGTLRVWSGAADAVELVVFDDTDLDWITEIIAARARARAASGPAPPRLLAPAPATPIRVDGPLGDGRTCSTAHAPRRALLTRPRSAAASRSGARVVVDGAFDWGGVAQAARPDRPHGHLRGPRARACRSGIRSSRRRCAARTRVSRIRR